MTTAMFMYFTLLKSWPKKSTVTEGVFRMR